MWHSPAAAVNESPEKLDLALTSRLREVVAGESAAESELHELIDHASGLQRALDAQVHASEQRLTKLNADPSSPLTEIASELRRVDALIGQLDEARALSAGLEQRTREIRTAWLKHHAESKSSLS
jgi:chromosome segregation ATPase